MTEPPHRPSRGVKTQKETVSKIFMFVHLILL